MSGKKIPAGMGLFADMRFVVLSAIVFASGGYRGHIRLNVPAEGIVRAAVAEVKLFPGGKNELKFY